MIDSMESIGKHPHFGFEWTVRRWPRGRRRQLSRSASTVDLRAPDLGLRAMLGADNEYGQVGINNITGNDLQIGDNETPASVGPVGTYWGSPATGITLGNGHACALLEG